MCILPEFDKWNGTQMRWHPKPDTNLQREKKKKTSMKIVFNRQFQGAINKKIRWKTTFNLMENYQSEQQFSTFIQIQLNKFLFYTFFYVHMLHKKRSYYNIIEFI